MEHFFESWLVEQKQHLEELVCASKHVTTELDDDNDTLSTLIEHVLLHYEHYYVEKSKYAKEDVLGILNPSWRSNLEDAFLWIGGWRPSMAIHLLYSKSGLQLEARFFELLKGLSGTENLGGLSLAQLNMVDKLQHKTIMEEKRLFEKLAKVQESVADTSMVELSNVMSELMRAEMELLESAERVEAEEEKLKSSMAVKEESLVEILQKADDLRLSTLKEIVLSVLTPVQAVHFLIAAAELHLRLHEWGMKKDAQASVQNPW